MRWTIANDDRHTCVRVVLKAFALERDIAKSSPFLACGSRASVFSQRFQYINQVITHGPCNNTTLQGMSAQKRRKTLYAFDEPIPRDNIDCKCEGESRKIVDAVISETEHAQSTSASERTRVA